MDSKLAILLIVVAAVAGYVVANNMDDKAAKSDKAQATKSAAAPASSSTLAAVKKRDQLVCGVSTGLPGFSQPDTSNKWSGLDVDVCRAVAAAVLGDANKVKYTPLSAKERFTALTA